MNTYSEDFAYKHKMNMGDRVRGKWRGMPFAGSVAIDTMIDTDEGPYVMVFLDLPLKFENSYHTIIKVKHEDLIDIKGQYGSNSKTNSKKSKMDYHK